MKYYLLDYENVNASGLDGIGDLSSDCRIVLFYTKNSSKIDLGVFNMLRNMEAEMSIIEVHHGKQALDIQLASYLGYLIGTEPADTEYFIISKDKGYRNVQSFWPDRRIVLCRNLSPESEIVDEPAPEKKTSSRSGSRGGRKSSSAKASTAAKAPAAKAPAAEEPQEKPKTSKSSGRTKAQAKPADDVKVEDVKKDAPKKDAPKAEPTVEPAASEEPKPNAFAEAAAIAKAVVEAKKARNEAAEKKAEKAGDAPAEKAEKPVEKEEKAEKPAKKAKKTASKKKAAESKEKSAEAKPKADSKQKDADAKQKAAEAKHKASDIRNEVNNEIQKRLSKENVDGDIINSTASFVSKNIGKDGYKQIIYRGIIKEHGQKQGLAIYRLIKDIL